MLLKYHHPSVGDARTTSLAHYYYSRMKSILLTLFLEAATTTTPVSSALALSTTMKVHHSSLKDVQEPNFHTILECVGKTCLRPGGTLATQKLLDWSGLTPNDKLLEVSAGLGKTGMMFAKQVGCHVILTDLDEQRLQQAQLQAGKLKPPSSTSLVETKKMDMFDIDNALGSDAHFDCAMAEASLTHYTLEKKQEFFQQLAPHADQYLLHEICFKPSSNKAETAAECQDRHTRVQKDMRKVLKIGFFPETEETWRRLLTDAGFTNIDKCEVGDIQVLSPSMLLRDEGPMGVAKIAMNVATDSYLRSRMLATRQELTSHKDDIGYIILRASKN